jgi:hypothetical protein
MTVHATIKKIPVRATGAAAEEETGSIATPRKDNQFYRKRNRVKAPIPKGVGVFLMRFLSFWA